LVTPARGVVVRAHEAGTQELATLYDFDLDAMRDAIERCINMSPEERTSLGHAARDWYEANDRTFRQHFLEAIDAAATTASAKRGAA
jgi:trehalose-6-phosphate synthase